MPLLDRAVNFWTGIGGGAKAVGGWVFDIAGAPFGGGDDEYDGFWSEVSGRTMTRLGELAENTIGPDEGLGALIGGLPSAVREPARSSLEGLDLLGAHAIRRPVATSQVLANEAGWGQGMLALNPAFWMAGLVGRSPSDIRNAWNATEHISVGQSLAFNLSGTSLFDNQQRTEFMGSDFYRYGSGVADAAFRLFADVDILAAKGFQLSRARAATQGLRSQRVVDAAWQKYANLLDEYPAGAGPDAPPVVDMTPPGPDTPRLGPGGTPVETPHGSPSLHPGAARARALDPGDFEYRPTFEVGPDGEIVEVSRFRPNVEGRVPAAGDDLADEVPAWMLTRDEWAARQPPETRTDDLYDAAIEEALTAGETVPAHVLLQRDEWARDHLAGRVLDLATDQQGRAAVGRSMRSVAERARQQLDEPWARRSDARAAVDELDEARRDFDAALAAGDDAAMAAALDRGADAWSRFSPSAEPRQFHQMMLDSAGGYRYLREPGSYKIPADPFDALYTTPLDEVLEHTRRHVARQGGDIDAALAGARLTHKGAVLDAIRNHLDVPDEILTRYAADADVARALQQRDRLLGAGAPAGSAPMGPASAVDEFEPGASDIRGPGETFDTQVGGPTVAQPGPTRPGDGPPPPPAVGDGPGANRPFGHEVDDRTAWLAGRIRGLDFSDHALGSEISYWLARAVAEGGRTGFDHVWRFLAGDVDQLVALSRSHEVLASRLAKMFGDDGLVDGAPDMMERARAAIDRGNLDEASAGAADAIPEELLLELSERMTFTWNAMRQVPAYFLPDAAETLGQKAATALNTERIRQRAIGSEFWHSGGVFGRGVRTFFNMRPHHIVDLNSQSADIQLQRMLRDTGMDDAEVATWRGRFQSAFGTASKTGVWDEAEQAAWRRMADRYDHVDADDVEKIVEQMSQGKFQTRQVLQRKTTYDGEGRAWVHLGDGLGEAQIPLGRTQMQNVMPVVDFKLVERHLKDYDDHMARFAQAPEAAKAGAREAYAYILDNISNYWKSAVLLRPGWTMRVVVMDEQLRAMAKFGALSTALDSVRNVRNLTHDYMKHFNLHGEAGIEQAGRVGMMAGAGTGFVFGGPVGAVAGGLAGRGMMRRLAQMDEVYRPQLTINGYKVQQAFGAPGDEAELFRRMSSSHQDWIEFIARYETGAADSTYRNLAGWDTIAPTDSARYGQAWEWAVNKQIKQDGITIGGEFHEGPALRFMRGQSKAEVAEWLTTTRAGRSYLSDIHPLRRKRMQEWLDALEDQTRHYTANYNPRIVENILEGRGASFDDLVDAIPKVSMRPPVHGQALEQTLGKGPMQAKVDEWIQEGFRVLGGMPSDRLSRWPAFEKFFEAEMHRLLADIKPGMVDERVVRQLEGQARTYALNETRELMYDLAERSEFGEMVRHLSPFYSAWQEVLTRWAGLAVENPAFVARLNKVWNAPEAGGFTYTDDQGDEHLMFRIPESAKSLLSASPIFESALDEQGFIRIPKNSFNMLAEGIPSVGPFVQLPISKVIEAEPTVERAFDWMFPYGSNPSVIESFMPAWTKRFTSAARGQDDRAFATAYIRNLQSKLVRIDAGLMEPMTDEELLEQVEDETRAFFSLRVVANFVSPVTPIFDSPYAPYIEAYRELRLHHDDADAKFLEEYGEEFFWLTRSMTKVNDGIPATLPGHEARERYRDLIERHPELGGLVVGSEGSGAQVRFSSAMYDRQLDTPIREGSDIPQRERLSPEEFLTTGRESAGWDKFTRAMDLIDAHRIQAGLPNLKVAEARPLANAKRVIIEQLARQHPEWYRAYSEVDMAKWNDRLIGLWEIASDQRLANRPDIAGLKKYLEAREVVLSRLEQADSRTLDAQGNAQLAAVWDSIVNNLVERNLAFGELYHRYLERDPMGLDTRRAALTPMRETA